MTSTQSYSKRVTPQILYEYDKGVQQSGFQIDGKWEDVSTPYYDTSKENQVEQ